MKKQLPILSKPDITLYTHHSLPLTIPFLNEMTKGWYMNNFINIFYHYEYPTFFDYTDYKIFYDGVLDTDSFTYSTALQLNTNEWFVRFIKSEKYIYAWVDQYYISATEYYHKRHDVHPILIYGYDLITNVYYCKLFSVSKSIYDASINIVECHLALYEATQRAEHINDDNMFCLYKVRGNLKLDFSFDNFLTDLYDYTYGRGTCKNAYLAKKDLPLELENIYNYDVLNISCYGLEVTNLFCSSLLGKKLRCYDYRLLHMICENKELISKRLQYIVDFFAPSDAFMNLAFEYKDIAEQYQKIRRLAMKLSIARKMNFYRLQLDEQDKINLYKAIKDLFFKEKKVLCDLLPQLVDVQMQNRFECYELHKAIYSEHIMQISFDSPRYINNISLFSYSKCFSGKLYVDDNIIDVNNVSGKNYFVYTINGRIKHCTFIPHQCTPNETDLQMYAVSEHRPKCEYLASSTYSSDMHIINVNNLKKYDSSFWCSDVKDAEPYVEVIFEKPICANTVLIEQHIVEKRIAELQVQTFINGSWYDLERVKVPENQQVIKIKFETVYSCNYKVKIIKTRKSDNGFAIPNIMLLKVIEEK